MKNLHLLLVGINKYTQVNQLHKAVEDTQDIQNWISSHYDRSTYRLSPQVLLDEQATRQGIINAFEHMARKAQSGDVCLFYFSGHGSNVEPPQELFHLSEGNFESIICYDSRKTAYDLTDKELSYLIWKVTHGKDLHFAAIMDCCHSGDSTRSPDAVQINRTAATNYSAQPVSHYYGYTQFRGGNYPPRGSHILLSACQHNEEATDGVFTSKLIAVLEGSNRRDYEGLMATVKTKIRGQRPSIYAANNGLRRLNFLNGAV